MPVFRASAIPDVSSIQNLMTLKKRVWLIVAEEGYPDSSGKYAVASSKDDLSPYISLLSPYFVQGPAGRSESQRISNRTLIGIFLKYLRLGRKERLSRVRAMLLKSDQSKT